MNAFMAIVKKEIASVLRDRTIVIAILIQLFIASFSSALLLGMLSLYDADTIMQYGGGGFKFGIVGASDSPLEAFLRDRNIHTASYETLAEAEAAFFQGEVNAILLLPQQGDNLVEVKLYLMDQADALNSLIRMVLQEPLKRYENHLRLQNGIQVYYADLKGKPATAFEFVYSILLPLLMFFPAFVAGSMVIDSLTEEIENNTLPTLLSAPLTINRMIGAKITAAILLAFLQCIAWLALLGLNGIEIRNTGWVLSLAVIVAAATSVVAALAAVLFKDRERSQFIYSLALLAAVTVSTLINFSPVTTLSRLAINDYYTSGWNVAVFALAVLVLATILTRVSRRLAA